MMFGLYAVKGASEKIIKIMDHKPLVNSRGGIQLSNSHNSGEIELKNVSFHYPTKKDVEVCKDISLKVSRNQVVALVGASGSGKSSIISLI